MFTPFHMVNMSPWPILVGWGSFLITINMVAWMWLNSLLGLFLSFMLILIIMYQWWRDIIREATWQGYHTLIVQRSMKIGMLLFIASEVMLFVSFFWAFFHSSLSPTIELGVQWPPVGIVEFDPYAVPLLNTVILVSSGVTLTWGHFAILNHNRIEFMLAMIVTLILAICFTGLQMFEYYEAPFTIADSIYGSLFFMMTGFHGFHVIIGSMFLGVCLVRMDHFSSSHHVGLESASWYWHFVDVVWLCLYLMLYLW